MKLGDMTNVPLSSAAAGSRASTMANEQTGAADLAWRREMERAQSEAWFLGVLPTSAPGQHAATTPSTASAIKPTAAAPAMAGERLAHGAQAAGSGAKGSSAVRSNERHAAAHSKPAHAAHALSGDRRSVAAVGVTAASTEVAQLQQSPDLALRLSSLTALHAAQELPFEVHVGAPSEEAPGAAADEQAAAAPRAGRLPVRVHVEGDEKHSTVWLGVDAAALAQLPDLAMAVRRWLTRAGYGEPTWICNGQALSSDELAEGASISSDMADASEVRSPRSDTPKLFVMNQTPGETV